MTTQDGTAVRFRDVVKRYGDLRALDGLTLDVPAGGIYGLLGPNGSGKTTSIKCLMGIERHDAGTITVLGEPAPRRKLLPRIGYMPQETALYHDLTVMENLELFGALYGLGDEEVHRRAERLLDLVDLAGREDSPIDALSGGMRRRTSLVTALLHEPDLLVLDEPTVGVDPELRVDFWRHLRDLRDQGKTLVITTHYMDEARNCDRIGLMRAGRLLTSGTLREVLDEARETDLEVAFVKLSGRVDVVSAGAEGTEDQDHRRWS